MLWRTPVLIYCPCRETQELQQPEYIDDRACFHLREDLAYCENCSTIRCRMCLDLEPVLWYCPLCLLEVPEDKLTELGYSCPKRCFLCPNCRCSASVRSTTENKYAISCSICNWVYELDKQEKAHGLRRGLAKLWEASHEAVDNAFLVGSNQRLSRRHQQLPLPVSLRSKESKICKACREVAVMPELTFPSIKFDIENLAINMLPRFDGWIDDKSGSLKIVVINTVATKIAVEFGLLQGSDLSALTGISTLAPSTGKSDLKTVTKQVPDWYITRQTSQSRQAFLEQVRANASGETGKLPWHTFGITPPQAGKLGDTRGTIKLKYKDSNDAEIYATELYFLCPADELSETSIASFPP